MLKMVTGLSRVPVYAYGPGIEDEEDWSGYFEREKREALDERRRQAELEETAEEDEGQDNDA